MLSILDTHKSIKNRVIVSIFLLLFLFSVSAHEGAHDSSDKNIPTPNSETSSDAPKKSTPKAKISSDSLKKSTPKTKTSSDASKKSKPTPKTKASSKGAKKSKPTRTPKTASLEKIVAVVNNDVILQSELKTQLNNIKKRLKATKTKLPSDNILAKKVLDRLILMRLQLQLAKRTGIRVDDETVNRAMLGIAKKNKLSFSEFRKKVVKSGFSFEEFRESILNQIIMARLHQRRVHNRVTVSKQEIDNFLANKNHLLRKNNRFKVGHILIALSEVPTTEKVQKAQKKADMVLEKAKSGTNFKELAIKHSNGQKALEGGTLGWFSTPELPRYFVKSVVKMNKGDVSNIIRSPAGFHIIKLIDIKGSTSKHVVKQTKAVHILIKTNELVSANDAKTRLTQIRDRLSHGEKFADLAKAHSDDTFSAKKGGDLGWVSPGALVPKFQTVMDKTEAGKVSEPFQTRYGWHIVKVIKRRQQDDTKSFKRSLAKKLIRARKQKETLDLWLRKLRDESYIEYRLNNNS